MLSSILHPRPGAGSKLALLSMTLLGAAPGLAFAADARTTSPPSAAASADTALDVVVVTAQKRAENVQDVPLSIAAVSGAAMQAKGVTDVTDLQKLVPNLSFSTVAQSAGVYFRIRGIGAGSNAAVDPSVAPYLDGVYIPRPGAILSSFLDVDHVEVLRGPQGTLFGRNATVGAIAIDTVTPKFGVNSGQVSAEGGNHSLYKVEGVANFNVSDKVAARVAAFDQHTDGYYHDNATGQTYGRTDTFGGRVSLRARITENLEWIGRADYASTRGDGINLSQADVATATATQVAHFAARSTIPISQLTGPSFSTVQRFDNPHLNDHQYGLTSDLKWDVLGGHQVRLIDGFHWWGDTQTDGDVVFTALDLLNRHGSFRSESQSHELQLISPKDKLLGGRLDYVAGLYYVNETYDTGEVFDVGSQLCGFVYGVLRPAFIGPCNAAPKIGATKGLFSQNATSEAVYAQADYKIISNLTLTLGGRYTHDGKSGLLDQTVANRFVGAGVLRAPEHTTMTFSDSRPTWRANLSWRVDPNVMTFVSYSTGYKSGGFNNNGGAAALNAAERTFQSETSDDIELGVKSTFFHHRLLFNADLYQTGLHNFQDRSFNGLTFLVRNAGDVRARGVEVESVIKPINHVSIDFGAAYLDSVFTANHSAPGLPACTGLAGSCPTVQDLTGHPTTFAPKWTTDLGLQYDTAPFAGGWTAQVRGSLNYGSRFYTTNDDNPQSLAGGQTILGARATLFSPNARWSFSLYGDNLTDQHHFSIKFPQTLDSLFGVRVPATGATLLRGFMGAPLTFGGRVAVKF
ncbi:MAG TPA: TonB-dependent receptor [Chloroflexota bacterium]